MSFLDDNKKEKLKEFVKFVRDELQIKDMPKILIQNNRNGIKTTAKYDYTSKEKIITVLGKNRSLVDIMRSIGHELVHHKQFENGELKIKPPDIGGKIEDYANSKTGQLIKIFAKKDFTIYDM